MPEVQSTEIGKVNWVAAGEVQNIVSVPAVVPATEEDEAKVPAAYAGFACLTERNTGLGRSVDSVTR